MNTETHELSFRLLHVAKYAKNHYRRTNDLFADLKLCLQKDDYMPETEQDVLSILTTCIPKFIFKGMDAARIMTEMRDSCHPKLTWRRGYLHESDDRRDEQRNKDGEHNNRPYNLDEAIIRFYLSELRHTTMEDLGLSELPPQCIPELYKEPTMYAKVFLTHPHTENDPTCPVGYNDYGKLVLLTNENRNEAGMEPQHVHFCAGASKQGELAYSESQGIVGVNGDSFNASNPKCIASSASFKMPWGVSSISKPFYEFLVALNGKIDDVELVVDKDNSPIICRNDGDGVDCVTLGTKCWKDIQERIKEAEEKQKALY